MPTSLPWHCYSADVPCDLSNYYFYPMTFIFKVDHIITDFNIDCTSELEKNMVFKFYMSAASW